MAFRMKVVSPLVSSRTYVVKLSASAADKPDRGRLGAYIWFWFQWHSSCLMAGNEQIYTSWSRAAPYSEVTKLNKPGNISVPRTCTKATGRLALRGWRRRLPDEGTDIFHDRIAMKKPV